MKEIWKDVKDYEGCYKISNYGRVKSLKRWRVSKDIILKCRNNKYGYRVVDLCDRCRCKKDVRVHRLVGLHFIPNLEYKKFINHKDCNKTNNHVDNLEWVTAKENTHHAIKNGNHPTNKNIRLTDIEIQEIRDVYPKLNQYQLAIKYNVCQPHISDILNMKRREILGLYEDVKNG